MTMEGAMFQGMLQPIEAEIGREQILPRASREIRPTDTLTVTT